MIRVARRASVRRAITFKRRVYHVLTSFVSTLSMRLNFNGGQAHGYALHGPSLHGSSSA